MPKNLTYLDYNATAPLRPEAREAMLTALEGAYNASSVHGFGRTGRKIIENARQSVAALTGAPAAQVIFNSGATEGNNTVLRHFAGERVLVSAIEHPSVLQALPGAVRVPVTPQGTVDLNALEDMLKSERTGLVSVMLANNETGAVQPVAEISALAKRHGALFHCDAVQGAGRVPLDIAGLGADFLTLSAHKLGGPQGVGALVLGLCGITPALLTGGGQEKGARAGTENIAGIAGFGAACDAALNGLKDHVSIEQMRSALESGIEALTPSVVLHARESARLANTSLFSLPGARSETLMMALDLEGMAVSNGSACSSGTVRPSAVLKAMGLGDDLAGSAIRVSLGWNTCPEDIDAFLAAWKKVTARLVR